MSNAHPRPAAASVEPLVPENFPPPRIEGLAVAALVTALLSLAPLGVVFGHVAKNKIARSNGRLLGRGLAIAGMTIGYVTAACWLLLFAAS